jgi:L-alanine-DL-glutamate epimerase-like enolase superfamily enzyme
MRSLTLTPETWPIAGAFKISSKTWTESFVLVAEIREGDHVGRGECEPHDEDPDYWQVRVAEIETVRDAIESGCTRDDLLTVLPSGPARNAVDCALFDLEAKRSGRRAWELAGVTMPQAVETVYTISFDAPEAMATQARQHAQRPMLKLKLGAADPVACVTAVRDAAPDTRIIIDVNQAWTFDTLRSVSPRLRKLGVELIEQPLPVGEDDALDEFLSPVPLCADESCLDRRSLPDLIGKYDFVNVKLDKTGGLTEALLLVDAARKAGLGIMVGCMVGTSLAMAPAMIIAAQARYVDLDGPLLLARDRDPGLVYDGSLLQRPTIEVWG